MNVGVLVECGRDGLEHVVVNRICELMRAETGEPQAFDIVPMDSKTQLIRECGPVVAQLLNDGCDRVVLLWDERPAWPKRTGPLCWHNDRTDILANLRQAEVDEHPVFLVCIEREFESWLMFDEPMLRTVLCTPEHPKLRKPPPRNPDSAKNPKGAMTSLFKQHGKRYIDVQFARKFAQGLTTLGRLRRCQTFQRFETQMTQAT